MARLRDIAKVVRSKNAGPFWLTMDIMFHDRATYDHVLRSGVITQELISRLYRIEPERVNIYHYAPGYSLKISIPRPVPAGDVMDTDVYATQQHAPLLSIEIPGEVKSE